VKARIGKLRHRLTLEQAMRTDDGGGGAEAGWEPVAELWAAVEAVSGTETVAADRISGQASYLITIRHREDLRPAMRFRRGAELFHILSALDQDGRKRFLVCHCARRDL
jgi:SPP1 family predicted phage head-tail adaptor